MSGISGLWMQIALIPLMIRCVRMMEDPLIVTKSGILRGSLMTSGKNEFLAFRGIPYALPPINERRFALPSPARSWTGILNATADGQHCMYKSGLSIVIGDEDCLYLNVYIPKSSVRCTHELYPVMVFIHGGGFTTGSGSFTDYGPQRLMETSSVVVVTINFRLGVFGFLSTEDEISPGNYGMWDQILALKWIQNNIAEFGGDPKLVTIFGESSGAGSVVMHLLSLHSKDLFSGAICQSGSAVSDRTIQLNPLSHAKQLAKNLNCPIDSSKKMIQCLKKTPALQIMSKGVLNGKSGHRFRFWPVVDKTFGGPVFLDDLPSILLSEHRINAVPVISGVNRDEGVYYYVKAIFDENVSFEPDNLFSVSTLRHIASAISTELTSDDKNGFRLYNRLVDEYFKEVNHSDVKQVIQALSRFVTDSKMNIYIDFTNKMLHEHGMPVYAYKLTHRGEHSVLNKYPIGESNLRILEGLGIVGHADELQYFWHCEFKPTTLNDEDKKMSDIMLDLWTSFAKARIPSLNLSSHDIDVEWLPITAGQYKYLDLSLNPHMVKGELTTMLDLWDDALEEVASNCRSGVSVNKLNIGTNLACGKTIQVLVSIRQGMVSGFMDYNESRSGFYSFRGIPYAKPPVGDLRFKDPEPHEGWNDELSAIDYGPLCPQWDSSTSSVIGNEDCLTLNVFTRVLTPTSLLGTIRLLPVMVWIHGGGFIRGGAAIYGPAKLMAGPIVLVTLNYRLGALGFLSTDDESAPGNYAMLDMVLALRWVRENIHVFGGDPRRVTIFGESAGAAAVSHLIISPLAKDLFWAAITQSGSALCDWALEENPFSYAVELAAAVGCKMESSPIGVDCLRRKSVAQLVEGQQSLFKYAGFFPMRTAPVVDSNYRREPFMPDLPETLLRNGNFTRVPLITGVVEHEGLLFLLRMIEEQATQIAQNPAFLEETLLPESVNSITDQWYTPNRMNHLKKFYFKDVDFSNPGEVIAPYAELLSDILFFSCNDKMAKLHSKFAPVYMYVFGYRGNYTYSDPYIKAAINMNIHSPLFSNGASHVDDLLYLFDIPNMGPFRWDEDRRMQAIMIFLWTTFAKQGTPNRESQAGVVFWHSLRDSPLTYLNISSSSIHDGRDFRQFQLSIFDYVHSMTSISEKYEESRESYYIATWVLVTLSIIFIVACVVLIVLLMRASHRRAYSTSNLESKL